MRKNSGIAVLLFAILLQMCSSGLEFLTLPIGAAGVVLTVLDDSKNI